MKINCILMGIAMLLATSAISQQQFPYYCDFNTESQESEWQEYRLGSTDDLFYTWSFFDDELQHNYPVGGTEVTDDWIVSPVFDFSSGATIDSISHAFGGFGTPMEGDTIMIYAITGSSNPELATDITPLALLSDEDYNPDYMWRKRLDINIPAISGESHIAFRYKTINNWLDVQIDDLYISGTTLGINDNKRSELELGIFPNPSSSFIKIANTENEFSEISFFDLSGKLVKQSSFTSTEMKISIMDLPNGSYVISAKLLDGRTAVQKLSIVR